MNRRLPMILFTILLTASLAASAWAERPWLKWSPDDGVSVRQGYHTEWYRGGEGRYVGANSGEVAFIWSDCRYGDRGVYVQVIKTNLEFRFPANGHKISDASNRQEDPGIYPSRDGGWYCVWEDFDADSTGDIYCTKIDSTGRRLWGNDDRGIAVCRAGGIQMDVRIVDDNQGGCIIAWSDQRGGDPGDLYAHHILADGRPDPDWPENGLPIVTAVGAQVSHTADEDGQGGMIIGWRDGRNVGNSDIWAQRITPDGQLLWGDGEGVVICGHGANQEAPKLCPDGANGAFFIWGDDRNLQQSDKDIYAQHVNADGELLWPQDGEALVTEVEEQTEGRIVDSESGFAIVLWEDKRADGLTYDIYAQRISGNARMRKEWDRPQGVPVVVAQRNQQQGRLFPDGQGGAYFVWEDERDGGFPEIDIWAQRCNRAGQMLWQENGIPVCRTEGNQNSPLIRRTANGGAAIAWGDYRSGSQGIFAQILNPDGQARWEENGRPVVDGIGGNALNVKAIYRGDGWSTVLWLDSRYGGFGAVPFIQTIRDVQGEIDLAFAENGIPVVTGTVGGATNPDGCSDGEGGAIVVWEDHRVGDIYSIYAQKVNAQGQLLWGDDGVKAADYDYEQTFPEVCSDGAGGAIITWRAPSDGGDNNVYVQRLNGNGQRMWGERGVLLARERFEETIEEIIPDGAGGAVITWMMTHEDDEGNLDDDLYLTRVNAQGEVLWGGDEGKIAAVIAPSKQRSSRTIRHQEGFVMVWVDGRRDYDENLNDIYGQFFTPDGEGIWRYDAQPGYPICQWEHHQDNPQVAIDASGFIWVVWEDQRNAQTISGADIYGQKLNRHPVGGQPQKFFRSLPEVEGRLLSGFNYNQLRPILLHDGQNGMWLAWEDSRGLPHSDIYGIHFNPDGRPYQGWESTGSPICTAFHRQIFATGSLLTPRGDGGLSIAWEDKRATGKEELSNVFLQLTNATPLAVNGGHTPAPTEFAIESAYPNPFNSRATINFRLPAAGLVKASLYDGQGRLAADLGGAELSAGSHRVALNAGDLPSGRYTLRLAANSAATETSLILVK